MIKLCGVIVERPVQLLRNLEPVVACLENLLVVVDIGDS
jgi:hypothetical protein